MKITWLGQAGLLLETRGKTLLVDPYLSDSVARVNPKNARRVPVDPAFLAVKPDVLLFTHNHLDHYDPDTVSHYLTPERAVTVLAPGSVWQAVRRDFPGPHNFVQFNRRTEWTESGIRFAAVRATHSDPDAIGIVIDDGEKVVYLTGDTLYDPAIFDDVRALGKPIDLLFLPVNGVGNNMNFADAARFAEAIGAKSVVPLHFGLFDALDPTAFPCGNKVIPTIYKEIKL